MDKRYTYIFERALELLSECQAKLAAAHLLMANLAFQESELIEKVADETIKLLDEDKKPNR